MSEAVETPRPTAVHAVKSGKRTVSLKFTLLNPDELSVLSECGVKNSIKYKGSFTK